MYVKLIIKDSVQDARFDKSDNELLCKHSKVNYVSHTLRTKVLQSTYFWCLSLAQIEDSIQYLEGPNSTWKDHDRNLGVRMDPKIPVMVLPDTIWSFQVLNRVVYL